MAKRLLLFLPSNIFMSDWLCRTGQSKQHHQHSLLVVQFLVCNSENKLAH